MLMLRAFHTLRINGIFIAKLDRSFAYACLLLLQTLED
jgi:hypothetical protein